jgi:hypothetical protein
MQNASFVIGNLIRERHYLCRAALFRKSASSKQAPLHGYLIYFLIRAHGFYTAKKKLFLNVLLLFAQ